MPQTQKASAAPAKAKKTWKEKAKAFGNFTLGLGETVLGVVVMTVVSAAAVAGLFLTIKPGKRMKKAFAGGFALAADGVDRVTSPYGDNSKKNVPPQQHQQQQQYPARSNQHAQQYGQQQQYAQQQYPIYQHGQQQQYAQQQYPIYQHGQQQQYAQQQYHPHQRSQQQQYAQQHQPQATARPQAQQESFVKSTARELWQKAKRNPWKTLGVAFLVLVTAPTFPVGTAIASAIVGGLVTKSALDVHEARKVQQSYAMQSTPPQASPRQQQHIISQGFTPSKSPVVQPTKNQTRWR